MFILNNIATFLINIYPVAYRITDVLPELFLNDESLYERILWKNEILIPLSFLEPLTPRLSPRYTVITFGSLFGRPAYATLAGKQTYRAVQKALQKIHSAPINNAVEAVWEQVKQYEPLVGCHFRMGDADFLRNQHETMNGILDAFNQLRKRGIQDAGRDGLPLPAAYKDTYLYLATDDPDPKKSPVAKRLLHRFKKTIRLFDYADLVESHLDGWWRGIHGLENVDDKTRKQLIQLALPMVEQGVISKIKKFVGTEGSTFTIYIKRAQGDYFL